MNIEDLLFIDPFKWTSILAALFCGFVIGLEWQLRGKPVGIRTSSLIVLGTYVFVTLAMHVQNGVSDPSRIIGQIVTGVGFLGAGVMMSKEGAVTGVTSAATIWSLAAIGVCVSILGAFVAIKMALVVVAILYGVDLLESYFSALTKGAHASYARWRNQSGDHHELED